MWEMQLKTGNNFIKKRFRVKLATSLLLLASISGCSSLDPGFATGAGVATSFIMTDKLPTDSIAEAFTGLNCSYVKHLDDKGPICRSQDYGQVIEKPIYCYKSIGKVDCYDYPDPYGVGAQYIQ